MELTAINQTTGTQAVIDNPILTIHSESVHDRILKDNDEDEKLIKSVDDFGSTSRLLQSVVLLDSNYISNKK